jgi:hypothetical protein
MDGASCQSYEGVAASRRVVAEIEMLSYYIAQEV